MYARIARLSENLLHLAAILLVLAMLATVFLGVVYRAINNPLAWTDEMAQYLLVWTAFTGWIIVGNRRSHIRITMFLDRLRGVSRQVAEIFIQLLVAAFGIVLLSQSFGLIIRNLDVEWVSLPLSQALVYLPIPIAGAAVVLRSAVDIVATVRGEVPLGYGDKPL